ncbi:hypothetical protein [Nibricoccus aquaticus]|nr:hypothetical protein [Nibricoccus aquaticus]
MKKTFFITLACLVAFVFAVTIWTQRRSIEKNYYGWRVSRLRAEVLAQEKQQIRNVPAHQIYTELEWVYGKTRDYPRVRERIRALKAALADPRNNDQLDEESPEDGSWGKWHTEWMFKLIVSYDHMAGPARFIAPSKYPPRFLDRINSPEKLTAHLNRLLTSEYGGRDNRWELNETIGHLLRLVLREPPAGYSYHPELKETLLDWIMNTARDPETGYWGEHYVRKGRVTKTKDISITFHIVSYLNGEVPDWPKIIDTTLAIKGVRYGWETSNHDHTDAVELFRLGWKHASPAQQAAMRTEIQTMLDWCLRESLRPDGSFTVDQSSIEASQYFGVSFLARIGYFDPARRFWTDQEFPNADRDRERIIDFIRSHYVSAGVGGSMYRVSLTQLGAHDLRRELEAAAKADF